MKALKKPLFEFIPVFLGVVLALFFNNLNESRIERGKINGLLTKIELGTQKNIDNLEEQLTQNQKVLDSLMYYRDNTKVRIGDILSNTKGIRYIQFDLAAWNVLKSSELLVDVDYDLTSLLYLLNESIVYDANTLKVPDNASDKASKGEFITSLSDYIVSIKHRIFLSKEIQKLLSERK